MNTEKAISLLAIGLGGIISVSSAGGHYDFVDMAIGLVLLLLLWPTLKIPKAGRHERLLVSAIAGMVVMLISGVFVDHLLYIYQGSELESIIRINEEAVDGNSFSIIQNNQTAHAAAWFIYTLFFFNAPKLIEKSNK